MRVCPKCQAASEDDSLFCTKCGSPQSPLPPGEGKKAGSKKGLIIGAAVAACLIITAVIVYFVFDPFGWNDSDRMRGDPAVKNVNGGGGVENGGKNVQPGDSLVPAEPSVPDGPDNTVFNNFADSVPGIISDFTDKFGEGILSVRQLTDSLHEGSVDGIAFSLMNDLLFESSRATLSTTGVAIIRFFGEELSNINNRIIITGHTDIVPVSTTEFPSNYHLSLARAMSVLEILYEQIYGYRISTLAFGEFDPAADNGTEDGRRNNRRIEIIVLPDSEADLYLRLGIAAEIAVSAFGHNLFEAIVNISEDTFNMFILDFMIVYGQYIDYHNITLADSDGIVLFRSNYPFLYGDSIAHLQSFETAISGSSFMDFEFDGLVGETARAAVPVYGNDGGIIGVLMIGG